MSKVKIQGNASGTGVVTLTAPNTNTDRTITLPDGDITLSAGGPSLGTDAIIRTNGQTISENITIPSTTNGMSIGDITVADGYTVTVNGRWVVI
jgi:hypothetical protein